ncbi:glyoxalase/bleomycin resistance/extradiol dioxygenase family protein [Jiangella aurantiaca]|uniref:Glyoxalase/bleomycin resistance/extradiol dioxygenase family protein n=1 Tax=Jiangella aurantiaca TaxID=2530373 RepID=A0A4R4ZZW5_9ACTN|nr:VOC family protein [Jiangella aurantiaca]TDD64150.1 glyoxalase/bleomycin resistance/extradiol dioxygenase family protein [Jiangella aurantiaca]
MAINGFYPVICSTDVAAARDFYVRHFGFAPTFEADWYVSLRHPDAPQVELAVVDHRHPTVPERFRQPARGLLLNLEVPDVDEWYARLVDGAHLPVALDLRDEAFGQRHFIVEAPGGVLVDVITPIEPTDEYAAQYAS